MRQSNYLKLLFCSLLLTVFSCVKNPHELMEMGKKRFTLESEDASLELANFAKNPAHRYVSRCWSLKSLSNFQKVDPKVFPIIRKLYLGQKRPELRSWSAISLGNWMQKENIRVFAKALEGKIDDKTAYYSLEALIKLLPHILSNQDLNELVLWSLNKFWHG